MGFDIAKIRADFPILSRKVHGRDLVYLDSGASAQKPQVVIDAVTQAYAADYANVHRGLHFLSNLATEKYEAVRGTVAQFLGAKPDEIILNSGTTEGINMVAYGWAMAHLKSGDEIVLSLLEHHANIVPWNFLRERYGVSLKWVAPEADGSLDPQKVLDAIGPKTRLIAVTHMSNVLGTVVDVAQICSGSGDIPVLVDGSQAAVHMPVNVGAIGCDFYAITGHKLYGPSGSGAIYVREDRMREMQPFIGGGDMIREVRQDGVTYADGPLRFEAGTPGIVQQIGFGAALDYMSAIGMTEIAAHEADLTAYGLEKLGQLPFIDLHGHAPQRGAIFSFTMQGQGHPHDITTILDRRGIALRVGQHCAGPLMAHLGVNASARASMAMYNTRDEIDLLVEGLEFCHDLFA